MGVAQGPHCGWNATVLGWGLGGRWFSVPALVAVGLQRSEPQGPERTGWPAVLSPRRPPQLQGGVLSR